MEVGCLTHPRASTIGSQLLAGDRSHDWQILATQPKVPKPRRRTSKQGNGQFRENGGHGRIPTNTHMCRHS